MEKTALHVYYSGRVQGVGFRFTAEAIAVKLGLVGWVKNIPDGRVEVLCEGREEDLLTFLDHIRHSAVGRYIKREDIEWIDSTQQYSDFNIRFV
ncbi:MAG: acylphosphatase [Candidatus Omnitrophica bacterium]|nr:acylphosphatase [Candidatus Omnitrophota bacterium]